MGGKTAFDPADVGEATARRLLDSISSHAVFMLDSDGTITEWPRPAEALYGSDASAMLGEDVRSLFADTDGTEASEPPSDFLDADSGTVEVEHWHERADGSVFWATMTLSPLVGDEAGFAAVCRDETTTKEYERMLERQNDRLKEFTDILAHDLRNPLEIIDGNLTLYAETGDEGYIETIDETTDRMARLVDDLLRVARQGDVVTDPEPTDIEAVVDTAWQVMGTTPTATLAYHDIPAVSADGDRLCELFENLFRNSLEHGGTDVTIHVGPLETGFYIEDDGPGIPEEQANDVFDHGFTTTTDGNGYGLSVVRTIVNAHGWDIFATRGEAGGARFEITGIEFLD